MRMRAVTSPPLPASGRAAGVVQAISVTPGAGWIFTYLVIQFLCQLALLVSALAPFRILFRSAAFGTSLFYLALVPGSPLHKNPLRLLVASVLAILTLSWMNPEGEGLFAASAHWLFHLAIVAPVFWVARLRIDERGVERLALVVWAFYAASAAVGVLQAVYPGRFQPAISVVIMEHKLQALTIRLSSGDWILRPMGLTDVPGGAAYAGFYAILLGIGVLIARPFRGARIAGISAMLTGAVAIYLSQVRAVLVLAAICLVALVVISVISGRITRFFLIAAVGVTVALVAFSAAVLLGGETVTDRLSTLVEDDAGSVYYTNRGLFIEYTFSRLLPEYPLGVGLGRWGMMSTYFGTPQRSLWAEVQWTGWLYDGGLPLLLIYPAAILLATWNAARLALGPHDSRLAIWASIIFAYDVGAIALTFSYPNFMGTTGIEFWIFNAALLQGAVGRGTASAAPAPLLSRQPSGVRPFFRPALNPHSAHRERERA